MSPTTAAIILSTVIKHHLLQGGKVGIQAKQCLWPSVGAHTGQRTMNESSDMAKISISCLYSSLLTLLF